VRVPQASVLLSVVLLAVSSGGARAVEQVRQDGPQPYFAPPFRADCTVQHFREGQAPEPTGHPDDPLCVEYSKRDINLDNGGAVRFLLAEPSSPGAGVPG
jgi:hypothetical protein